MRLRCLVLCGLPLLLPLLLRSQPASAPVFLQQPADIQRYVGEPASLSAVVTGSPNPTFQWTRYGVNVAGATNATFSLANPAVADSGLYQLVATNSAGTATSALVVFSIVKRPQTIDFPAPAAAYPAGSSVTLPRTTSAGLVVSYRIVSGPASLNGNVLVGSGGNVVVRASQAGTAAIEAAANVDRTFSFVAGGVSPLFPSVPAPVTVDAGSPAVFRATVLGTPFPTLQWSRDGTALPGATRTTLEFAAVTPEDAGRYTLTATNALGSTTTAAELVVRTAPRFVREPADLAAFTGERVELSAVVAGVPAPALQWRRDGAPVPGATAASLVFDAVGAAQAGRYELVATNALGSVASAAATLTVRARDFAGAYFGRVVLAGAEPADLALHVRPDRSAVLLAHLPSLPAALIVTNLRLGLDGAFAHELETVGPFVRTAVLRGALDSETGTFSATLAALGATLSATRSPAGPAADRAGLYTAAVLGSAAAPALAIVGADGQALLVTAEPAALDSVRGTLDAGGVLQAASAGRATVRLAFADGLVRGTAQTPAGATLTLAGAGETLAGTERLANLSARANTSNAAPLIGGFVVAGSTAKQVLVRVAGPALAAAPFNLPNALADPTLQLFRGTTAAGQNDNWGQPPANAAPLAAAAARAGAFPFPNGSADAALLATLAPGPYTFLVGGGNGTVVAEVYEVLATNEAPGLRRLANLSARGQVTAASPLVAGLVISGPAPQRVLVRAIGPTLGAAPFNVPGTLANPRVTLFRGPNALRTNDDWFRDPDAAALRTAALRAGAFTLPAQSADAALLVYLEPGAYTVQVDAAPGSPAAGIALVEVYDAAP